MEADGSVEFHVTDAAPPGLDVRMAGVVESAVQVDVPVIGTRVEGEPGWIEERKDRDRQPAEQQSIFFRPLEQRGDWRGLVTMHTGGKVQPRLIHVWRAEEDHRMPTRDTGRLQLQPRRLRHRVPPFQQKRHIVATMSSQVGGVFHGRRGDQAGINPLTASRSSFSSLIVRSIFDCAKASMSKP